MKSDKCVAISRFKSSCKGAFTRSSLGWFRSVVVRTKQFYGWYLSVAGGKVWSSGLPVYVLYCKVLNTCVTLLAQSRSIAGTGC